MNNENFNINNTNFKINNNKFTNTDCFENNINSQICSDYDAKIRVKLKWFFADPFIKYKIKKLNYLKNLNNNFKKFHFYPWKLVFQILKIILITTQIIVLLKTQINNINVMNNLEKLAYHTFIMKKNNIKKDKIYMYSIEELNEQTKYIFNQVIKKFIR